MEMLQRSTTCGSVDVRRMGKGQGEEPKWGCLRHKTRTEDLDPSCQLAWRGVRDEAYCIGAGRKATSLRCFVSGASALCVYNGVTDHTSDFMSY